MEDCEKVNYHRVGVGVFPPGKCLNLGTLTLLLGPIADVPEV